MIKIGRYYKKIVVVGREIDIEKTNNIQNFSGGERN